MSPGWGRAADFCTIGIKTDADPQPRLETCWVGLGRQVAEASELQLEQQLHIANGVVAVLGPDRFGDASAGSFRGVVAALIANDHQHWFGFLLS